MDTDMRQCVIDLVLGHIANDFLRRSCRMRDTDSEAAYWLKAYIHGGFAGHEVTWAAHPKGVVYGRSREVGARPSPGDDGAHLLTWIEVARAARADTEQLALL